MMRRATRGGAMRTPARLPALMTTLVLAVSIGCHTGTHVGSGNACPRKPLDDAQFGVRYLPCQLTKVPVLKIDTAIWRYPAMAQSAGVSGRVRLAFIVDTSGHYVRGSARELSSTHRLFTDYTKYQLSRTRFSPGRRGRETVPVELIYDLAFAIPAGENARELGGVPTIATLASVSSSDSVPLLEIRLDAEDPALGPPPDRALRDSLAHIAIRLRARELGWKEDSSPPLLLCVQGDTGVFESAGDRALAASMTRPHVRVMTLRGCPPTRDRMVVLPAELQPHYPPDAVPFIEPHRLHVTGVALRRGGGPQVDLFDEYRIGGTEYRCLRIPRSSSIYALRCIFGNLISH